MSHHNKHAVLPRLVVWFLWAKKGEPENRSTASPTPHDDAVCRCRSVLHLPMLKHEGAASAQHCTHSTRNICCHTFHFKSHNWRVSCIRLCFNYPLDRRRLRGHSSSQRSASVSRGFVARRAHVHDVIVVICWQKSCARDTVTTQIYTSRELCSVELLLMSYPVFLITYLLIANTKHSHAPSKCACSPKRLKTLWIN